GDGRKPVRKVFGQVAVLQAVWGPGRPPDGGIVGHFVEAVALYTLIAVEAEIPLQQRNRLQPQLLYHREPLGVHRLRHPADGGRKTLVVEAPVAAHVLNAAGIHEHLRRVGDVVDVVEAGEKHIGRGGELVKVGQRRNHPRRVTGGDGGHRQSPLHAPDPDPVRAILLAGEYERAALGDERHFVYASIAQHPQEGQRDAEAAGHEDHHLVWSQVRAQRPGHGLLAVRGDGYEEQLAAGYGFRRVGGDRFQARQAFAPHPPYPDGTSRLHGLQRRRKLRQVKQPHPHAPQGQVPRETKSGVTAADDGEPPPVALYRPPIFRHGKPPPVRQWEPPPARSPWGNGPATLPRGITGFTR